MSGTNAYFQLEISNDGVYFIFYPSTKEGENLKIDEVTEYLDFNHISNYDIKVLNEIITKSVEKTEKKISNIQTYPIDEYMVLKVTKDNMYAVARFYPPSVGRDRMSEFEIKRDIEEKKIKFGIREDVIADFVNNPRYCTNIVVAMGQKPVNGHDANIEYKFNTDRKAKPRLNEDGTVDFHQLDNINHVKKGEILAVLNKEDAGMSGMDVYGNQVRPVKVNKAVLRHGKNIHISEDGCTLISEVNGHVTLEGDRVFVSDVYEVPADVDNSTGDIEYNGSILIKGNVRTGFAVKVQGNAEIYGVVEGADIYATGDIILHRGIQGMGKAHISCGGNLISKFIESAHISAGGYIETDTILHSDVSATGEIHVRGKSGNIIGGNVRSSILIEATNIGSPMGTGTEVEVGVDPAVKDKYNALKKSLEEKYKEKEKLEQVIKLLRKKQELGTLEPEKAKLIGVTTKNAIIINTDIKRIEEEYESLSAKLADNVNAQIKVTGDMHQGVKVSISGDFIYIHEKISHVAYKKEKGEILPKPL